MKKSLLLTLLFLFAAVPAALAQSSASDDATVTANVLAALTVTAEQNLDFGNIAQGDNVVVDVTDGSAGKFSVTGESATNVTLTYNTLSNLADGGGNTLPFSQDVQVNSTSDDPSGASALTSGATQSLNGSGNLYVYLGGTVTADASQAAGSYSGTFTLTAEY